MDDRDRWLTDADVLAQIGQRLFTQELRVLVRLPRALAEAAAAAWAREDGGDVAAEGPRDALTRHRAGCSP